jgi:hypothetical protein
MTTKTKDTILHVKILCKGGSYLCPLAIALWDAVNTAYRAAARERTPEAWGEYDKAITTYRAHQPHELVPE